MLRPVQTKWPRKSSAFSDICYSSREELIITFIRCPPPPLSWLSAPGRGFFVLSSSTAAGERERHKFDLKLFIISQHFISDKLETSGHTSDRVRWEDWSLLYSQTIHHIPSRVLLHSASRPRAMCVGRRPGRDCEYGEAGSGDWPLPAAERDKHQAAAVSFIENIILTDYTNRIFQITSYTVNTYTTIDAFQFPTWIEKYIIIIKHFIVTSSLSPSQSMTNTS